MKNICKRCGKELKTWNSIQKGFGPICEKKYLDEIYTSQQIAIDSILTNKDKREER